MNIIIRRRNTLLWLGCVFFLLFFFGCRHLTPKKGQSPKPECNVVLITIDTLRADHLGCYGNERVKTPNIDKLAGEGVLFSHAYTPVPVTLPSHTSIFTGLYPVYHGVRNNGTFKADEKLETLAEVLKENGFQSAAFIGAFVLDSRYGLDQGFDCYDDYLEKDPNQTFMVYNERSADEVIKSANVWLDKNAQDRFFMWIHCFDPHAPYSPPAPFSAMYQHNLYNGEVAYTDYALGKFFNALKEKDLLDETLVVITSDHGEGLGEHAEKTHAIFIYDSTLHVPLIMRYPGAISGGAIIEENVSMIDIMPTVLDILNIKKTPQFHGESLLGLIHGKSKFSRHEILCETFYPLYNHNWSPLEGLRTDKWKYIKAPRSELYDLENDPREMVNLFSKKREIADQLEARMKELQKEKGPRQTEVSAKLRMDKDTQERLKSLGYIWTTPAASNKQSDFLPDPKDMITTLDYLNMGTYFYTKGDYDKAVEQFKLMLKVNPKDVFTHFVLGYLYDRQDLTDLAIQELEEAIRLDPTYVNAYNNLGTVFNRVGKLKEALEVFTIALELNPDYLEVYDNLGVVYFGLKKYDKAIEKFQRAIELNPENEKAYNNLGSVYLALRRNKEAEEMVLKALEKKPAFLDALNNLGSIHINQRKYTQAIQEFQKVVKNNPDYFEGWVNLSTAYIGAERYDEARQALQEAISLNPDVANVYTCLGTIYVREGNLNAAIEQFKASISLDPNCSDTHYNLGISYYNNGQIDLAIEEYTRSLSLDPSNASAHVNLGIAYFNKGLPDRSLVEYQQALLLEPDHEEAHINLGVIYYNKGQYDKAIALYQRAIVINPASIQAYVNMGLTYLAKGMINEAIREYRKVLEISPNNLEAHLNLASAFFSQGEYDAALRAYLTIVQIDPKNPLGYYGLGYSYFYQGLFNRAIEVLQNALRLKPDYLEARLLLDRALSIGAN